MAKTIRRALRGKSSFVSDIYVRGMLYGATIRSPYPRARILSIDTSAVPDSVIVVTAADIPGTNGVYVEDEHLPVLASSTVEYAGEPVVLLAGETQAEVVGASHLVAVEFEELPALLDLDQRSVASIVRHTSGARGRPDTAMAESEQVVEGHYSTGIQEHLYNEPQGAVVVNRGADELTIHCASQWPYHVRKSVAENLGIKPSACTVITTDTGVDLDGKLWYPSVVATHAALLSQQSGKSTKLVYSNLEDFQFTPKRAPVFVSHLTGLDEAGNLVAAKVDVRYNCGAYGVFTREMNERLAATALGLYGCDNVEVNVSAVRTNLPPMNVFSGFGTASTQFAMETHASRIVEIDGADPVTWRMSQFSASAHGRMTKERAKRTVDAAVGQSDFRRKNAAFLLQKKRRSETTVDSSRGIGLAISAEGSGFIGDREMLYRSAISILLEADGAVLRTSVTPRAGALRQHWISVVAEGLGLKPAQVRLETGRTDLAPDSGPSTLSRSIGVTGKLIRQACVTIQKRRFRDPLPIEVRRSYRLPKSKDWNTTSLSGEAFSPSAFAATVVEVSVDPVSFESRVEDVWLVVDAGKVLDADDARRSLEMGVYQALEWTTHESIDFHAGSVDPRNYLSYRRAIRRGLPRVHITLTESEENEPAGIGSLPFSCVPSALATAVSQATGRYMDKVPTNPELIHGYMEQS